MADQPRDGAPLAAFLSFRFGATDGVSVVTRTWIAAFESFGFRVVTVAGNGDADRLVPGLEIGAGEPPSPGLLAEALDDVDLCVVENLLTIPLNLPAARAVAGALAGRPAVLHHHDPPWQRDQWAHVTELPPDDRSWCHVTINRQTVGELAERGIAATAIYNGFAPGGPVDRDRQRADLDVAPDEPLVVHPVRAIPRKNIGAAIALTEHVGGTYWLLGPAEDGYAPELDRLIRSARCRVIHLGANSIDDAYAAADLVAYPSTWEGFGMPPIEASLRRRPVVVGRYPMADELRRIGFRFIDQDDSAGALDAIAGSGAGAPQVIAHNERLAAEHFSIDRLRHDLRSLLDRQGWLP
jgi:glycosyltransferase involved in cell wall biosynthesis